MGQNSDGRLFYGYIFDEEGYLFTDPDNEDGDAPEWEAIIAKERGIVNPWDSFPSEEHNGINGGYKERQTFIDAWTKSADTDSWYAALKMIKEEFGCDVGWMGYLEYSYPYISVNGSDCVAYGYGVKNVTELLAADHPTAEWDAKLQTFIDALGLEPSEGPGWFLTSTFG